MSDGIRLALGSSSPLTSAPQPPPAREGGASSSFRDALREAAHGIARREAALDGVLARRGAPLGPEQLLALQATLHRYTQEVELAAKLTDKLTGAVRQVLTSQQ
ncbi:MAG: hypothetical protein ACK6CU_05215 [Deltaproteobacteria bacterium]